VGERGPGPFAHVARAPGRARLSFYEPPIEPVLARFGAAVLPMCCPCRHSQRRDALKRLQHRGLCEHYPLYEGQRPSLVVIRVRRYVDQRRRLRYTVAALTSFSNSCLMFDVPYVHPDGHREKTKASYEENQRWWLGSSDQSSPNAHSLDDETGSDKNLLSLT
jgi:hypothetical protein